MYLLMRSEITVAGSRIRRIQNENYLKAVRLCCQTLLKVISHGGLFIVSDNLLMIW